MPSGASLRKHLRHRRLSHEQHRKLSSVAHKLTCPGNIDVQGTSSASKSCPSARPHQGLEAAAEQSMARPSQSIAAKCLDQPVWQFDAMQFHKCPHWRHACFTACSGSRQQWRQHSGAYSAWTLPCLCNATFLPPARCASHYATGCL